MINEQQELTEIEAQMWIDDNLVINPMRQDTWGFSINHVNGYIDGTSAYGWYMTLSNRMSLDASKWRNRHPEDEPTIRDWSIQSFRTSIYGGVLTIQAIRATALDLVKIAGEHEFLEWFTENGKLVEDPHE